MKLFIAISSCENWEQSGLNNPIRETWLADATKAGIPYKFFHGKGSTPKEDVVVLDCDDSYRHLAAKFKTKTQWFMQQDYDYMFACQPDCYSRPERLLSCGFEKYDYFGGVYHYGEEWHLKNNVSGALPSLGYYCQTGAGLFLSRKACSIVAEDNTPSMHRDGTLEDINSEDAWVGQALLRKGVLPKHSDEFKIWMVRGQPMRGNNVITSHLSYVEGAMGYKPERMYRLHQEWLNS